MMAPIMAGESPLKKETIRRPNRSDRGGGTPWDRDNLPLTLVVLSSAVLLFLTLRRIT